MAWEKLKHAFAVGQRNDQPLSEVQERVVERLCQTIRERKMVPAAAAFLELSRPLNYIGAQGLHFLEPFATAVFSAEEYREFTLFLERRDAIDILQDRINVKLSGKTETNSLGSDKNLSQPAGEDSSP